MHHRTTGPAVAVLAALVAALLPSVGLASSLGSPATNRRIQAQRFSQAPVIDGKLDDAVWATAELQTGFSDSYDGSPMPDQTEVRLGYDDKAIYVAFVCHDADPGSIVAQQTRREANIQQDDHVCFRINPFGNLRYDDQSNFEVNAIGTQEATIAGGRAAKQEWLGDWQGAAQRTPDGFTVEMSVPWSILNRPAAEGSSTMDVNFSRNHAHLKRNSVWSYLGPNGLNEHTGRWLNVAPPPAVKKDPLSLLGYVFGGPNGDQGTALRGGLDARYEPAGQTTLVGTLNPDFANIEGDVQSIDFSYSEKLTSERRPFFLEGSDYFHLHDGSGGNVFLSQRIPQFAGGFKYFGKPTNAHSIGMLGAFTSDRQDYVASWKVAPTPYWSLTTSAVVRHDAEVRNEVLNARFGWHSGNWGGDAGYGRSSDRSGRGDVYGGNLWWNTKNMGFNAGMGGVSPGYLPRDGYVSFTDVRNQGLSGWYGGQLRRGAIRSWSLSAGATEARHYDNTFQMRNRNISGGLQTRSDIALSFSRQIGGFEEFRDHLTTLAISYPATDQFHYIGVRYNTGNLGGSRYTFLGPFAAYRFGERLSVALSLTSVRQFEDHEQDIATVSYDLDKAHSISGRLVKRDGDTNWYLSYRQSGYGGLEYFVIVGDPNSRTFSDRFVIKLIAPL